MKIFLSSDMEGTAGVVDWEQCRPGQTEAVEAAAAGTIALPRIALPATLSVRMRNPDLAEMACWLERVEPDRDDATVVHLRDSDPARLYRTFITLVPLTRGIAE